MLIVLVRVSIVLMKHQDQKATWGGRDLLVLHFCITAHQQEKSGQKLRQGRDLEAGAVAGAMEGAAYWLANQAFLIEFMTTSPRMTPPTVGCARSSSITNKKTAYRLAHSQILWRHFLS